MLHVRVSLVASESLLLNASGQFRDLSSGSPLQIGNLKIQLLVSLIDVRLKLGFVAFQFRFHMSEERRAIARVTDTDRALSDVTRQIQVVLLAPPQRVSRQRVETWLRKRFRIRIIVAAVRRPLSAHDSFFKTDLMLLAVGLVFLSILFRASAAAARAASGLFSLLV